MSDWVPIPGQTLQPATEPLADGKFRLWRDAPGWRNLMLSAIAFSAALLTLPLIASVHDGSTTDVPACQGNYKSYVGPSGRGQVVGFLTSDQAMKLMQQTQLMSRMAINPDFIENTRTFVHPDGSVEGWRTVFLVPKGMNVQIGDRVEFTGGHIDTSLPCHYIPNLITRDLSR